MIAVDKAPGVHLVTDRPARADYAVRDEGTIVLVYFITDAAVSFREEHVDPEALTFGSAVAVDHRMFPALAEGLAADGLVGRIA